MSSGPTGSRRRPVPAGRAVTGRAVTGRAVTGRAVTGRAVTVVGAAVVVVVAVAIVVALHLSGSSRASRQPTAQPQRGVVRGAHYLALGDSIAFGYRPSGQAVAPDYRRAASFRGYPEIVAGTDDLQLANASCPGETAASMVAVTNLSNGCENTDGARGGYRDTYPLHVRYRGSQLGFAERYLETTPDVGLVTIDIGLNDVSVCQAITRDHCASAAEHRALMAELTGELSAVERGLREVAHYRGRLVDLSYYAPDYRDATEVALVRAVNDAVAGVTRRWGGVVADGYGAFERVSRASAGDPCAAALLAPLPGRHCDAHPSPRGQALLATAVTSVLAR